MVMVHWQRLILAPLFKDISPRADGTFGPCRAMLPGSEYSGGVLSPASGKEFMDQLAKHIRQPEIPPLVAVGQLGVIESEKVQQRRVQVVD